LPAQRFSRPSHSTALPPLQRSPDNRTPVRRSTLGDPRRGGRAAEGTRLLSEYGAKSPSRVRIPPSPSTSAHTRQCWRGLARALAPSFVPCQSEVDVARATASTDRQQGRCKHGARHGLPSAHPGTTGDALAMPVLAQTQNSRLGAEQVAGLELGHGERVEADRGGSGRNERGAPMGQSVGAGCITVNEAP